MSFLGQIYALIALGEWDEAAEMLSELMGETDDWLNARQAFGALISVGCWMYGQRGETEWSGHVLERLAELSTSADVQERCSYACGQARLLLATGNGEEALRVSERALEARASMGPTQEYIKEAWVTAVDAAFVLGDDDKVENLLAPVESLQPGLAPLFLRAQCLRFRARLAGARDDEQRAGDLFGRAVSLFRELAMPFYLAVVELEYAEWLERQDRHDEAELLAVDARERFAELKAEPWLERVAALGSGAGGELVPEQLLDA
jgi:hypothetical protein